jgi:hypothetical protein
MRTDETPKPRRVRNEQKPAALAALSRLAGGG